MWSTQSVDPKRAAFERERKVEWIRRHEVIEVILLREADDLRLGEEMKSLIARNSSVRSRDLHVVDAERRVLGASTKTSRSPATRTLVPWTAACSGSASQPLSTSVPSPTPSPAPVIVWRPNCAESRPDAMAAPPRAIDTATRTRATIAGVRRAARSVSAHTEIDRGEEIEAR